MSIKNYVGWLKANMTSLPDMVLNLYISVEYHLLLGNCKVRPSLYTTTPLIGWLESNMTVPSARKDMKQPEHSYTAGGNVN